VQAAKSLLQTAGVLVALWLALLGVGVSLGALPPEGGWLPARTPRSTPDAAPTAAPDADAGAALDAGSEPDAALGRLDAPPPDASPPPPSAHAIPTHAVCPEPAVSPSLAVLQLGGDARPEIVVGCGAAWHVLAGSPLTRVARLLAPPGDDAGLSAQAGTPAALDFDGDGAADLALPFVRYGAGGATSGGGLYVLRASGWNVFGEVRAIAPIAASAVAVGPIDAAAGDDLVGVNQQNPFARLPSEGWVFSGGAAPRRSAVLRAATGASAAALVDLDLDGLTDVALASTDDGRLDVFFGDGAGRFPRQRTFDVPSASGLVTLDVDGDAHLDLVVEGAQPALLVAGPDTGLGLAPIDGTLRGMAAFDLAGDGRAELVGFEPPALVALRRGAEGRWERTLVLELADPSFGVRRQAFADLDGDGAAEVVLLGTRTEAGARMLELMIVPATERGVLAPSGGPAVLDAPWVIEVPLPEAQPF
jgi:hypothetical protein